jgi:Cu2+-exporting ATPase
MRCQSVDLAEKYAGNFVIAVLVVAGLTFTWWFFADPTQVLGVTLSVLVVSCPCAFSLASPAVSAAASRCLLKRGIILTRGNALESLARTSHVIFDKTGTLTSNQPDIETMLLNPDRPGLVKEDVLKIAACLEQFSAHPVARAFRIDGGLPVAENIAVKQGSGISGNVDGQSYRIGQQAFVLARDIQPSGSGQDGIWLTDERGWLAVFKISDGLRPGSRYLVRQLQDTDISVTILSGDNELAVASVARQLNIKDWEAGQTPEMKLERLCEAVDLDGGVLMVGDGVNDAPVLAAADVSIAVHGGADLANAAADFILTGSSLSLVWEARRVALAARRIIRQNLAWAISYNLTMIPLAVSGMLKPWMAALGMSASSLLVVLNAARIGRVRPEMKIPASSAAARPV